jgi:hypothetical protein
MKKLRRITEAEVISEFLKGEFFHPEYDADREQFVEIVNNPDLTNEAENAIRQALLFRRRDTMWWELPEDRQWWEIDFAPEDVDKVSVFPRAHWRKIANGDFKARHVAAKVREQLDSKDTSAFAAKMRAVYSHLEANNPKRMIVFLGLDENHPVTLLEGNHRFIASLLVADGSGLNGARTVGVFSPHMEQCCWYKTNFKTLFRCLKNRIQHKWDRDTDVSSLLQHATRRQTVSASAESALPIKQE